MLPIGCRPPPPIQLEIPNRISKVHLWALSARDPPALSATAPDPWLLIAAEAPRRCWSPRESRTGCGHTQTQAQCGQGRHLEGVQGIQDSPSCAA
ncbi:hypothetical protein GW7_00462 [Heterocephalus glaber]|uniref:Uncharacterized protein n=1 Tax=Heterocephalus glaber TaxID=10181 RepID=G5C846_HETGA|nr:hypothetical protein GW7_00462 [Heterocephalus glaber]